MICYQAFSVKTKLAITIGIGGMLAIGLGWHYLKRPAELPRIRLPDGGEFRVVQVRFTPNSSVDGHEHNLGAAPAYQFTLWRLLPKSLQSRIPYPRTGIGSPQGSDHPAISIWWAYINPKTGKPQFGPTDYFTTFLDNGEQLEQDWPDLADDYRQIFIRDPPTTSRHLRFRLSAEDQPVEFSIENPAYRK
jgi:hypothetical protein